MIQFEKTWAAIMQPGAADNFFQSPEKEPILPFRADEKGFSLINAWWLSEISRLIYRQGPDEIPENALHPLRTDILASVSLKETHFFNNGSTQCAVVRPVQPSDNDFAVLVFRGTNSFENWLSNLNTIQVPWPKGGQVHSGFKNEFIAIWPEVADVISKIDVPVFIAGHSLGGALALLAASVFPAQAAYTFGGPRVGDAVFGFGINDTPVYRMTNNQDIVPAVPPSRIPFDFCHVGEHHHYKNGGTKKSGGIKMFSPPDLKNKISEYSFPAVKQHLTAPPDFLSDHAPVNYSAHLTRELFPGSYINPEAAAGTLMTELERGGEAHSPLH